MIKRISKVSPDLSASDELSDQQDLFCQPGAETSRSSSARRTGECDALARLRKLDDADGAELRRLRQMCEAAPNTSEPINRSCAAPA
jgi:hypothetical protein